MALNNILVPNMNNIYSNSLTMNLAQTQPVAGNNTLWLNSANNHLYRDGVDLERNNPILASYFIPPTGWAIPTSPAPGTGIFYDLTVPYVQIDLAAPGANERISCSPSQSSIPSYLKLSSFRLVYSIDSGIDPLLSSIGLEYVSFVDQQTQTQTPIPFTGTLQTTPGPLNTEYITTFTVTNPVTLTQNQILILTLNLFGVDLNSYFFIYGVFLDFTA